MDSPPRARLTPSGRAALGASEVCGGPLPVSELWARSRPELGLATSDGPAELLRSLSARRQLDVEGRLLGGHGRPEHDHLLCVSSGSVEETGRSPARPGAAAERRNRFAAQAHQLDLGGLSGRCA
ncbi:MAG: hypothetical protein ABR569_01885 [Gaiellaceae bacterium]